MRYTIEDAAETVGLSVSQVRRRLHTLSRDLNGDLDRGSRGKVLLTDRGLAVLRRAVEIERDRGICCSDAVKVVNDELGKTQENERHDGVTVRHGPGTVNELVVELRARIGFLEQENSRLWGLVNDLRALPAPKEEPRRPWILRVLWPNAAKGET